MTLVLPEEERLRQAVRAELGAIAGDAIQTLTQIGITVPGLVPAAELDAMRRQRDGLAVVLAAVLHTAETLEGWPAALVKAASARRGAGDSDG